MHGASHIKIDTWVFLKKIVQKIQTSTKFWEEYRVLYMQTNQCVFVIVSRWILKMKNVSDKRCGEFQTRIYWSLMFFWKSYRLWDNVEEYGREGGVTDDNGVRRMRVAYWIIKATDTHT